MKLSRWFTTLGNPDADEIELTGECFKNLPDTGVQGYFSSHNTNEIPTLIDLLNALGDKLQRIITGGNREETGVRINELDRIRNNCEVAGDLTVDLGLLCVRLKEWKSELGGFTDPILECLCRMQIDAIKVPGAAIPPHVNYQNINIYFPRHGNLLSPSSTSELPSMFQQNASVWCEFVDTWRILPQTIT